MNTIFIATSLDGYIADRDGKIDYLSTVEAPEGEDFGYAEMVGKIDAIVMGRATMEMVLSFGVGWPYEKPVFVLSRSLTEAPEQLKGKVEIMSGSPAEIVIALNEKGFENLYIDGGKVIQSFLAVDMIDEMIISKIPVLLGGGSPLFGGLPEHLHFEHVETKVLADQMVQSHYRRNRS